MVIRWGDPVVADAPAFDPEQPDRRRAGKAVRLQLRLHRPHPLPAGSTTGDRFLMVVNHEYTDPGLMFAGLGSGRNVNLKASKPQVEVELAAHGGAVVEIAREGGTWKVVDSKYARRISANTPFDVSGPAAGHDKLKTSADPTGRKVLGMLNNCAGGSTPWGTWLTCEENFNGYFGGDAEKMPDAKAYKRYGVSKATWYAWSQHIDRFNVEKEPNEPNRFGWIVEIDPYDPGSTPMKRTALGRFKHEGCTYAHRQGRPRGVLQRRRRALRLCLQVRHRAAVEPQRPRRQQGPAGRRHALRRPLQRRRQGRVAAAGPRPGPADGGERLQQPGRRADLRARRRRPAEGDADGPAGGRRDQPGERRASMSC